MVERQSLLQEIWVEAVLPFPKASGLNLRNSRQNKDWVLAEKDLVATLEAEEVSS